MPPPESPELTPALVLALAEAAGHPSLDPATAARIAAGATAAVRAVAASAADTSLFDAEPTDFLAELERLAAEA